MRMLQIDELNKLVPGVRFEAGNSFCWSPKTKTITYNQEIIKEKTSQWALLHEVAHADLDHVNYSSDLGLLKLEVAAWDQAKLLAERFNIKIDEDHVQDCLDTYRDWLYKRSTCPNCDIVCLQSSPTSYKCHNCCTTWTVSASRFCRSYRLTTSIETEKRPQTKVATFS